MESDGMHLEDNGRSARSVETKTGPSFSHVRFAPFPLPNHKCLIKRLDANLPVRIHAN
jgi:hypothetical protein